MHLDGLTLMAAGSVATAASGLLLLGAWLQIRAPALLWWAAASIFNSAAVGLLIAGFVTASETMIGTAAVVHAFTPAFIWAGVRHFNHRRLYLPPILAGALATFAGGALPLPGGPALWGGTIGFAVWVVYLAAAIFELLRQRDEPLNARWPLVGLFAIHAFVFTGGIYDNLTGDLIIGVIPPLTSWFSLIHFETLIYSLGTSVFMVLMCKERSERRHMIAARNDSLTGIANRGAFLENAARALRRCQSDGAAFSVIMFDLDHFKRVNDTFGHEVGDEVLRTFAETTRAVLRPNDFFGRYGGEEFVAVLPGTTVEAAFVVADRARHKFAEACAVVHGRPLNATVSAGVTAATPRSSLDEVIRAADQCMYRAKHLGRNRVERSVEPTPRPAGNVIRVA